VNAITRILDDPPTYFARESVFVWPGGSTERGEQIVSSGVAFPCWIRLEKFKHRPNFSRDVLCSQSASEIIRVCYKREIESARVVAGEKRDAFHESLVEGMSQIADSGSGNMSSPSGYLPIEFDLERFVACLRIDINDIGATISLKEGFADCIELVEVFASLRDEEFRALEGHG
jgi:hypothetical protein